MDIFSESQSRPLKFYHGPFKTVKYSGMGSMGGGGGGGHLDFSDDDEENETAVLENGKKVIGGEDWTDVWKAGGGDDAFGDWGQGSDHDAVSYV